jgi:hypothetical protein
VRNIADQALNPSNQQINRFNNDNKHKSKELTISSKIRYKKEEKQNIRISNQIIHLEKNIA